jgi:exodeoxyribonuclease-3
VVAGTLDGIRIVDVYVVNGRAVGAPEYEQKLCWLDALVSWLRAEHDPGDPLLVAGDFNVAPQDRDVHDPDRWRGLNMCSEAERARVEALFDWGLVDLMRLHEHGPGPFTWWDYRAGAFHRGWGLRLDLALGTRSVAERCTGVIVEREERKPTFGEGKPSDHAPVIVTLA